MDIKELMNRLLKDLDKEGFILQYYEAYSTSSCYIKLDYGECNSIRIADHKGKNKYPYRFNLMVGLKKSYEKDGRKFYSPDDYDKLISDIKLFKEKQLEKYGFRYYEYMLENKNDNSSKKVFGQNLQIIMINFELLEKYVL